jgi:HSP20 family molecular chaperone IbpA
MKRPARTSPDARRRSIRPVGRDEIADRVRLAAEAISRRAFELFEQAGSRPGHEVEDWLRAEAELFPPLPVAVSERQSGIELRAEVPGFRATDLEVALEPRRVTILGERESRPSRGAGASLGAHSLTHVFHTIELPRRIDCPSADVKAKCEKGVLTVIIPRLAPGDGE